MGITAGVLEPPALPPMASIPVLSSGNPTWMKL